MTTLGQMPGAFRVWIADNFIALPDSNEVSFEDLSRVIEAHASECRGYPSKKHGPLLFAGAFVDGATSKDATQLDSSRLPPFALVDLDGDPKSDNPSVRKFAALTSEELVERVRGLLPGVRLDMWTTYSHGAPGKGTRMRILIALTRGPASLEEMGLVWAALNSTPGGLLVDLGADQCTYDPTRGQALPAAPTGQTPRHRRIDGRALDIDALIALARERGLTAKRPTASCGSAERPADVQLYGLRRDDLIDYALYARDHNKPTLAVVQNVLAGRAIAPNGERHPAMRSFTASLWHFVRRRYGGWIDPDSLWRLFEASCTAMAQTADGVQPDEAWVRGYFDSYAGKGEARIQAALREAREYAEQIVARGAAVAAGDLGDLEGSRI